MKLNIFKNRNFYVLVVLILVGSVAYYFGTQNTESSSINKTLQLTTTSVKQGDLEKKEEYNGTLRQTDSKILNSPMAGVVTFIPDEGTIVKFGEILFAVDNKPVILVEGSVPFYRTLDLNSDPGPDVLQLEKALVYLGYAADGFAPDDTFDEITSQMLNKLYLDYKIETKSEVTPSEQVAINLKETEVKNIEETIDSGGTTIAEVNDKKKKLDDAKEDATEESAAWKAADTAIKDAEETLTLYRDETNPKTKEKKADGTLDSAIEDLEQTIEEQKRIKALEKGKESGIDATEALAIETAQKAYDDVLKDYNEGVDQEAELAKAKEELEELRLASKSETFSPTNAYASETAIIVGSYINKVGSAVVLNSQLYNISSVGIEVVFQVDASDQETVSIGDSVEIELPTDERVPTVITFIDQVVTQTQTGDFIEVILEVLNPEEIEAYDQAPVKVFVTTEISENVLYVPVNALIALAEGGYALEIYEGEAEGGVFEGESGVDTIYVAVEIGVFTDGFVEIKGNIPVKALDGVSLNVKEGDLVAIVGQSGSGKSTLLNMIGLLDSVTDGSIEIEGKDISDLTDNELSKFRGEKIGFIFQSFFLLPGLTAQENVAEGLLYQGISRSERLEKAGDVLEQVGLGDRLSHLPKELSGGQQQRVAIARALVQDPAFVLADEPTGNLDKESGINILNILKELNDQGKTVIMITHNQEHANMFKKVIELVDGKIVKNEKKKTKN